MPTYNPNDVVVIQRSQTSSSFIERVLSSSINSILMFNSASQLVTLSTSSFGGGGGGNYLSLDQTSPQTVINGVPTFQLGLITTAASITGPGQVEAQFGAQVPLYMMSNFPALGFNSFYGDGFEFGASSSTQFGAFQAFDPGQGIMTYYMSPTKGNAGDTWTPTSVLAFTNTGYVGINQSNPAYALDVVGYGNFSNAVNAGQTYHTTIGDDTGSSNLTWYNTNTNGGLIRGRANQRSNQEVVFSANVNDLDVLDDVTMPSVKLSMYAPNNTFAIQTAPSQSSWTDGNTNAFTINLSTGFTGINQTKPLYNLDVNGLIGNSQNGLANFIQLDDGTGSINISSANNLYFNVTGSVLYNNNNIYGINRMYDSLGDYLDNYFNFNFVRGTQWQIQDSGQSSPIFYVQSKSNGTTGKVGTVNNLLDDGSGSAIISSSLAIGNLTASFSLDISGSIGNSMFGNFNTLMMDDGAGNVALSSPSGGVILNGSTIIVGQQFALITPTYEGLIGADNSGNAFIGDINGSLNNTVVSVYDNLETININANSGLYFGSSTNIFNITGDYFDNYFNFNFVNGTQWQIQNSSSGNALFYVDSYGAVGSTNNVFDDSGGNASISNSLQIGGNLGVGLNNNSYNLSVSGSVNFTGQMYQNGQPYGYYPNILNQTINETDTDYEVVFVYSFYDSPYLSIANVSSNALTESQVLGSLVFQGYDSEQDFTGSTFIQIQGTKDVNSGSGSYGGNLIVSIQDTGSNIVERMRIDDYGATSFTGSVTATGTISASNFVGTSIQPYTTIFPDDNNVYTASLTTPYQWGLFTYPATYSFTSIYNIPAFSACESNVFILNVITSSVFLSFPDTWMMMGTVPTNVGAGKSMTLNIKSFGISNIAVSCLVQH